MILLVRNSSNSLLGGGRFSRFIGRTLRVRNFNQLLLTALLVGAVSTAFASDPPYGDNLDYAMNGTTLVLTSPDPDQPATVNASAFLNRTNITAVIFPDNLTEIGSEAFRGCTGITDIVLPPSLTSIGVEAFRGCTALVSVLCRPFTAPALGNDGFTDCHASLQICVPNLGSYNATDFWKDYNTKLTFCSFLDENDASSDAEDKIESFRKSLITDVDIFRTLRKAGRFNTLTLPFNVPDITASHLVGAEVYVFEGATVVDGVLQLNISPLAGTALTAGTPYLIQWPNTGEVMTRLSFTGISWDTDQTADNAGTGDVLFHGFYGKTHMDDETSGEQHLNLFLGSGNQLYWPEENDATSMLGFRAWFQITNSGASLAPIRRGMPATLRIVATPTGIDSPFPSGEGRGEAATIVLRNGQLVIIRNGQTFSLNGQKL